MTFFSTTLSLALPLVTVNETTKPHIPQNNGLHCCQIVHNRRKAPLNLTNYQPCTQRKKPHINVSRHHVFQAVLNFHGFPSPVIFAYRLFISCRELYLVLRTLELHVVCVLPDCCWGEVLQQWQRWLCEVLVH
jgi:hypothetical protein